MSRNKTMCFPYAQYDTIILQNTKCYGDLLQKSICNIMMLIATV